MTDNIIIEYEVMLRLKLHSTEKINSNNVKSRRKVEGKFTFELSILSWKMKSCNEKNNKQRCFYLKDEKCLLSKF